LERIKNPKTEKNGLDRRGGYYQTIAKFFIDLRGAPFFLSSKELDIVSKWEEREIPLRIVLEGIKENFELSRSRQPKRKRPYTLDFCHSSVLRAFDLYQDRRIGQKRTKTFSGDKERKGKILSEIERFLADIPEEVQILRPIYSGLYKKLASGKATEEELEKAEEAIERLIVDNISTPQTDSITAEIRCEFGKVSENKLDQIFRIKAVKAEREKHKIPHVSPFYY
jgi:hypothetical protein